MATRKEAITLGVGLLVGAALGWLLGRRRAKRQADEAESRRLLSRPPLAPPAPPLQPESPSTPSNLAITVSSVSSALGLLSNSYQYIA
jgi:hypothetical protein